MGTINLEESSNLTSNGKTLELKNLHKIYDNSVHAVNDVSIDVNPGEFLVLVGPSGCGKSTMLRMLAGLEKVDNGEIILDGRVINNLASKKRDIAMVFQNYALYPTMRVYDNLAFPLKMRKMKKEDIKNKVVDVARQLEIEHLLNRQPAQLSGGQRQRVALGRAIVREPALFLMDEPLSNLDAELRVQMRHEIVSLQRRLGITTVYVTHDQIEAMTMGSRIAVMKDGVLMQVDTPTNLYKKPENTFVARFIGSPKMNIWSGEVVDDEISGKASGITFGTQIFKNVPFDLLDKLKVANPESKKILFGIRPEDFLFCDESEGIEAIVREIEEVGRESFIYVQADGIANISASDIDVNSEKNDGEEDDIIIVLPGNTDLKREDKVHISPNWNKLHAFSAYDKKRVNI